MRIEIPGDGALVLVREAGPRVAEILHRLTDGGARVHVEGSATDPVLADLASRNLVQVVGEPDLSAYDVVLRDPLARPAESAVRPAPSSGSGQVVLVGGGPGDPGLLTLAGMAALREADVVVCDRLAPLGVLEELEPRPLVIHVGKIPKGQFTPQEQINAILVEQALAGRSVVRLKGGDSFVFGRGGEEWNACVQAGVPVRVIPGVTSSIAAPELAGVPVTHRNLTQGFVVVSGHVAPDDARNDVDWSAIAQTKLTIVVLMGVRTLGAIATYLIEHGLDAQTPAASIADAGMPSQRSVTGALGEIAELTRSGGIRPPAVTVIGPTVNVLLQPGSG
ncbi:uroporphyrinogen-III C-methyltransferase [Dermatophilaceae bacterium Sec6.4]